MSSGVDAEAMTWGRAREGDGSAFAALFRQHQARVYRRALSMLESAHDAEDVTAAAFFELWRKRRTVRLVDGTVLPWLLVTTVNLARNHRRGAGRYRAVIASLPRDEAANPESTAVTNIETHLLGSRLAGAVAGLSSTDAALLTLTALEELSISDAAAAVGIKPGAARMRLHRARTRLQAALSSPAAVAAQASEGEPA
jgi:RNA polymerase sigma factor (sigma-70 family)